MKIGVISDTHGNVAAFRKALEVFDGADMIIHAGDVLYHPPRLACGDDYDIPAFVEELNGLSIPIIIAQCNCDPQVYEELLNIPVQSPYAYVSREKLSILASHGHLLSREKMIEQGKRYRADYFISGHTHMPVLEDVDGLVLMNPGSPAISKYEADGRVIPTVGLITETGASIIDLYTGETILQLSR